MWFWLSRVQIPSSTLYTGNKCRAALKTVSTPPSIVYHDTMREAINNVLEAEEKAAQIVKKAETEAAEILAQNDRRIAQSLKTLRENQQEQLSRAVEKALAEKEKTLEEIRQENWTLNTEIDHIAERILKRIMQTVFD